MILILKKLFQQKNYIQDYVPGSIIYGAGKTGKKIIKNTQRN